MLFGFLAFTYEFRWSVLWTQPHLTWLLDGLLTTLRLSIIGWIFAVLLGIIFGALRTVPFRPLRAVATAYVEFFRNVPLLVWLFFWYFGAPEALPGSYSPVVYPPWDRILVGRGRDQRLPRGQVRGGDPGRNPVHPQDPAGSGALFRPFGRPNLPADHHSHRPCV